MCNCLNTLRNAAYSWKIRIPKWVFDSLFSDRPHQLCQVTDKQRKSKWYGLIDWQKAFDTVDHGILLKKSQAIAFHLQRGLNLT